MFWPDRDGEVLIEKWLLWPSTESLFLCQGVFQICMADLCLGNVPLAAWSPFTGKVLDFLFFTLLFLCGYCFSAEVARGAAL